MLSKKAYCYKLVIWNITSTGGMQKGIMNKRSFALIYNTNNIHYVI